jgi:hypothetical protein
MKNKLQENMIRFGTKNLSEQLLKNLVNKIKGNNSEFDSVNAMHDQNCKGVTDEIPPAHFKTQYANNSTTLYFWGGYEVVSEDENTELSEIIKQCKLSANHNMEKSIALHLTNGSDPVPYYYDNFELIMKQLKNTKLRSYDPYFKFIGYSRCQPNKTSKPIFWAAFTIPVDKYNKLISDFAARAAGTTTTATPAVASATTEPGTTRATTSATPTTSGAPTKATHMYPSDRNYLYAKDAAGKWWAQNKKTNKWFDISTKYPGSVANLEKGAKPIQ